MEPNNLPAVIDPEKFGGLIEVPKILDKNRSSVLNASKAVDGLLAGIAGLDIAKVDATDYEAKMEQFTLMDGKLNTTLKTLEDARSPYTSFFDEIRTLFTTEEGKVRVLRDTIKTKRNAWEAEKNKRNRASKDEDNKKIALKQKAIDDHAALVIQLNKLYTASRTGTIERLLKTFSEKTKADLPTYGETLKKYVPSLEKAWPSIILPLVGDPAIIRAVIDEQKPIMFEDYSTTLSQTRTQLVDSIPGRLAADEKTMKEADEYNVKALAEATAKNLAQVESDVLAAVEGKKIDAVMDVSVSGTPVLEKAKGSVKSKKYKIEKMSDIMSCLKQYTETDLLELTIEEAATKFKFAITSANKKLNAGIKIVGLESEESFSTRS